MSISMIKCSKCGHENLPSFPTCSRCASPLAGGGAGPGMSGAPIGASPQDEYARLMTSRQVAARRNRMVYMTVGLLAIGVVGFKLYQDRTKKNRVTEKLAFFERWAELEKRETGSFWNCVMSSEVDINMFANANQVQQKVEAAYFTQQKTFADYLISECVPKIERARQAIGALSDAPAELGPPVAAYSATLPKLQTGLEAYADRVKNRKDLKDVDQLIQEMGGAWHASPSPSPEGVGFEKFLYCAIPGLDKFKDAQAVLEFLADTCFKKDPVAFMTRVRKDCGPLLQQLDPKPATPKTWAASRKKLYEEEARQLQAWESCGKKSRKGAKADDLADFLVAVGDYMAGRAGVAKAAKEIEASAK